MKAGKSIALACLVGLATFLPSTSAETFYLEDFAFVYRIGPDGSVSFETIGTYTTAILCAGSWSRRDLLSDLDLERIDYQFADAHMTMSSETAESVAASGTWVHKIRLGVVLNKGSFRFTENKNGTVTSDDLYTCNLFTLSTEPLYAPTQGWVTERFTATVGGPYECQTPPAAAGTWQAPRERQPSLAPFEIAASDAGLCLDTRYAGMIPPTGEECKPVDPPQSACVPYTGFVEALVASPSRDASGVYPNQLGGSACGASPSDIIIAGFCWGEPRQHSGRANPCDGCFVTVEPKALNQASLQFAGIKPVGTWNVSAYRAVRP